MDEATRILPLQPSAVIAPLTPRQWRAVKVIATQAAINAVKAQLQEKGLKPAHYSYRELVELAEDYIKAHRAEIVPAAIARAQELEAEEARRREWRRQRRRERN